MFHNNNNNNINDNYNITCLDNPACIGERGQQIVAHRRHLNICVCNSPMKNGHTKFALVWHYHRHYQLLLGCYGDTEVLGGCHGVFVSNTFTLVYTAIGICVYGGRILKQRGPM